MTSNWLTEKSTEVAFYLLEAARFCCSSEVCFPEFVVGASERAPSRKGWLGGSCWFWQHDLYSKGVERCSGMGGTGGAEAKRPRVNDQPRVVTPFW